MTRPPKNISPTDPAARWTAAPGGPAFYAYSTDYLIDLEAGIIVDVEATPAHRTEEVDATRDDDRARRATVRSHADAPGCGHGIWRRADPQPARQGEENRATHPGMGEFDSA